LNIYLKKIKTKIESEVERLGKNFTFEVYAFIIKGIILFLKNRSKYFISKTKY